jgi:hypothetical protein
VAVEDLDLSTQEDLQDGSSHQPSWEAGLPGAGQPGQTRAIGEQSLQQRVRTGGFGSGQTDQWAACQADVPQGVAGAVGQWGPGQGEDDDGIAHQGQVACGLAVSTDHPQSACQGDGCQVGQQVRAGTVQECPVSEGVRQGREPHGIEQEGRCCQGTAPTFRNQLPETQSDRQDQRAASDREGELWPGLAVQPQCQSSQGTQQGQEVQGLVLDRRASQGSEDRIPAQAVGQESPEAGQVEDLSGAQQ